MASASGSSITGSSTAMSRPGSAVRECPMRLRSLTRSIRNSALGLPHRAISRHNPQPLLNEVLYATRVGIPSGRVPPAGLRDVDAPDRTGAPRLVTAEVFDQFAPRPWRLHK